MAQTTIKIDKQSFGGGSKLKRLHHIRQLLRAKMSNVRRFVLPSEDGKSATDSEALLTVHAKLSTERKERVACQLVEIVTSSGLRKRCRLLELPAELRLHIYKFALSDMPVIDARTRYFPRNTTYALYDGPVTSCILCDLPLLRLNRQIRDEAIPYLSPCTNSIPDTWDTVRV